MKLVYTSTNELSSSCKNNDLSLTTQLFFLIILFSHCIATKADTQINFERLWPKLEQPWYFVDPNDIALDNTRGLAYVINQGNAVISKYTQTGEFIKQWILTNNGKNDTPVAIAVDKKGFVYVAHQYKSRIQKFDSEGEYVADILLDLTKSNINLGFIGGLAFAADDSLYLVSGGQTEGDTPHAVWRFSQEGKFIQSWGEFGEEPGKLGINGIGQGPKDIAISKNGRVYIADTFNQRIQVFSLSGEFITGWGEEGDDAGQFRTPFSIVVDAQNRVYVGNARAQYIQRFTEAGIFIDQFFESNPLGLAFNAANILFVADKAFNRVIQINPEGKLISSWQSGSDKEGHFNLPWGIDTDTKGNIYVVDHGNARVQKFSANGDLLEVWQGNDYAFDRGGFDSPGFIVVGNDAFYLTEPSKIIKFNLAGEYIATWNDNIGGVDGITIDDNEMIYLSMSVVDKDKDVQRIAKFNNTGLFLDSWQWEVKPTSQSKGLEVGKDGFLYVASEHHIYQFDLNGNFKKKWAVSPKDDGSASYSIPPDVAIDKNGLIYTVDNGQVIRIFNNAGELVNDFSQRGGAAGSINSPKGLAISSDGKLYVSDTDNHRIQQFDLGLGSTPTPDTVPRKAIIVAGGGPFSGNLIWDDTQILANRAYAALRTQGFAKDQIKYLTGGSPLIDLDNNSDSTDDAEKTTKENLEKAITEWAIDANDVVVYMIDHGGPGRFQLNATEILGTDDIQGWVDQLASKVSGKITVIIEACKSGSFIPAIAEIDRYIISSSSADQPAVISNKGLNAFSYFFWNEISNGANLQNAFKQGRQAMSSQLVKGVPQKAQLDSNGDGEFSADDFDALAEYCLGNCTTYGANKPEIKAVNPATTLQGESSLNLQMQIQSLDNILSAWATIVRPDYQHPDSDEPVSDLPRIEFSCNNDGLCSGQYNQFDVTGDYTISFYAQDEEYQLALPVTTTISQMRSNKAVYDAVFEILTLNDVEAFGKHYRVELFDQGGFSFRLGDKVTLLTEGVSDFPAAYNDQSGLLSIPRVSAFGKDYKVKMNNQGNFIFQLDLNSVSELVQ